MSERDPQLDPLPDDLAELFAAERARPASARGRQGRVRDRLGATLGIPAFGGGGAGGGGAPATGGPAMPAAPLAAGATGATGAAKAAAALTAGAAGAGTKLAATVAAVIALGGAALVGTRALRDEPAPAPAPSASAAAVVAAAPPRAPEPSAAAARDPGAASDPAPVAATDEPAPAPIASATAAPSSAPDAGAPGRDVDLAAERELLDSARAATARGQGGAAIALLERHAKEFPRGRLSEEREALWIRALVSAGRVDEARARAARFKRSFPRSLLLPSLEETLGPLP